MTQTIKSSQMDNYLHSQSQMVLYGTQEPNSDNNTDNISMDEFKMYVKKWFELDNYLKRALDVLKEKKNEKQRISEVIMKFMCKYNIEDLNTKEGRIRCKQSHVKAPVSKQIIKQRVNDYFSNDDNKKEELLQKIFEDRDVVEKTTLRRLKIS